MDSENQIDDIIISTCRSLLMLKKWNTYDIFNYKFYEPISKVYNFTKRSTSRRDSTMKKLYSIYLKDPANFIDYLYDKYPSSKHIWNKYFVLDN